jgi:EAL domain-containing protein (putative c-di-GMP-specific phosphodiesterase class I)
MPDGTIQTAGQFQEATSDPRLAYELTGQMLPQVAGAVRRWLDLGIPFQHVGFNVTQGDFKKGDLAERIVDHFTQARVPLKHIILEVNEAVYLGPGNDFVANAVERLRAKGILVALDDFGTGFASLTHLLHFPVDIIKIDRSFVTNLSEDRNSAVIVEALLMIAAKLDMKIVAEGIETLEQAECLLSMGCRLGQGYRFAPPVDFDMTTELLSRFAQGMPRGAAAVSFPMVEPSRS